MFIEEEGRFLEKEEGLFGNGLLSWHGAIIILTLFSHRHILELGSGVGLAGIAICRGCGPASYCFTDCHKEVLERCRENIEISIPQGQPLTSSSCSVVRLPSLCHVALIRAASHTHTHDP